MLFRALPCDSELASYCLVILPAPVVKLQLSGEEQEVEGDPGLTSLDAVTPYSTGAPCCSRKGQHPEAPLCVDDKCSVDGSRVRVLGR
jgi:hypothetical protein